MAPQPKVGEATRVCAFDRAGLAWSQRGPADKTVEQTVSDLHAILRATEKAQYVLVGASIGGIFIRAYQRAYSDDVAGLVFTNSSNRVDLRSAFPLPPSAKGSQPTREGDPFDRLPPDLQQICLWLDVRQWQAFDPGKAGPEEILSWRKEFLKEFEETDGGTRPLGDLPVIVLSSGPSASESDRQSRNGAAARLDVLSSNTLHIIAYGSGHEIHLFQPERVIQAVQQAVGAVRNRTPLSPR